MLLPIPIHAPWCRFQKQVFDWNVPKLWPFQIFSMLSTVDLDMKLWQKCHMCRIHIIMHTTSACSGVMEPWRFMNRSVNRDQSFHRCILVSTENSSMYGQLRVKESLTVDYLRGRISICFPPSPWPCSSGCLIIHQLINQNSTVMVSQSKLAFAWMLLHRLDNMMGRRREMEPAYSDLTIGYCRLSGILLNPTVKAERKIQDDNLIMKT